MDREQARQEALRRATRRKKGRVGVNKPTRGMELPERSRMTTGQRERLSEMERRRRILAERKRQEMMMQARPGMVAGAAVSIGKKNKDKIKKKISDIGNMKVKDAAKAIGSGVGALSPIGIGKSIGSRMKDRAKDRITDRDKKNIKDKLQRRPRMPTPQEFQDMLKDPKRALPKPELLLSGGQAKLDKNKNNKIDAQDFKILRAEKAKGRGMGLQDEKMKPGKVMKADKGGMGDATKYKKYLKGLKDVKEKAENKKFEARRMRLAGGRAAMNAIKASRVGKIAAGVAGAALLGKAALEKMYEKRTGKKPFTKREPKRTLVDKKMGGGMMMKPMSGGYMGGGLTEATQRLKAQGKMGGGMMMRPNPVGMKSGKSVKVKCKLGRNKPTKMY